MLTQSEQQENIITTAYPVESNRNMLRFSINVYTLDNTVRS